MVVVWGNITFQNFKLLLHSMYRADFTLCPSIILNNIPLTVCLFKQQQAQPRPDVPQLLSQTLLDDATMIKLKCCFKEQLEIKLYKMMQPSP